MDENVRDTLAATGEALAAKAGELQKGAADVEDFFVATREHTTALRRAGLPQEAFATDIMSLLTAFGVRFDPDTHAAPYLTLLLQSAADAAMSMQDATAQGDTFAVSHYSDIDAELGPLVLASYRELNGANILPSQLQEPFERLSEWVDVSATFRGMPITATLAPDILYDIAARLTAVGVIE